MFASRPEEDLDRFLESYERRELLRFLACGSVDDGKSTLIGRLLHDSQSVYEDQLAAAQKATARRGLGDDVDLSLLVDGLEAEREQGITIDVAYRYFSTPRRKFIIADTPGHEQYTRNMATGASTCHLAIILVDARLGLLPQTRRHAFIASLLGIKHLVVAVNKMDLVGYAEDRFQELLREFADFAAKLQVSDIEFIPVSALKGDNVVHSTDRMPWYKGRPLLDHLENVHIASDLNLIDLRFPVQYILRPDASFRGYAGTIASGVMRVGDAIAVLPSLKRTQVTSIVTFDGAVEEAFAPMAVTVTLADAVDVSRGDMLVHVNNVPQLDHEFDALIVWMSERPLTESSEYLLKQTSLQTSSRVESVRYRVDVNTLRRDSAASLGVNDVGRVRLVTSRAVAFDSYVRNRTTGAFILIDRLTNATVGAGMILDRVSVDDLGTRRVAPDAATNLSGRASLVLPAERASRLRQRPFVVWLTGLPRSGKSSIAFALERRLFDKGFLAYVLDGERMRVGISSDLGFSPADRREASRRAAETARTACDAGLISIVAQIVPAAADRDAARALLGGLPFLEVFCNASLEACARRDSERLYERARAGEVSNVTGVDVPYERPTNPDVELPTEDLDVERSVDTVLEALSSRGLLLCPDV